MPAYADDSFIALVAQYSANKKTQSATDTHLKTIFVIYLVSIDVIPRHIMTRHSSSKEITQNATVMIIWSFLGKARGARAVMAVTASTP